MIDHLEGFCKHKKLVYVRGEKFKGYSLNYDAVSQKPDLKSKLKNLEQLDNYSEVKELSIEQLKIIGQYISDFDAIIKSCNEGDKSRINLLVKTNKKVEGEAEENEQ